MQTKQPGKTQSSQDSRSGQSSAHKGAEEASDDFDIIVKEPVSRGNSRADKKSRDSSHLYFTEKDLSRILHNLDELRDEVYPSGQLQEDSSHKRQNFPSVCLIGLGRCGSNIALGVAALVHNARNYYLNEFNNEQRRIKEKDPRPIKWLQRNLKLNKKQAAKPV